MASDVAIEGEKVGKYRLMGLLATGGMGEVFLARQEGPAGFAKTVVVKRILRHLADDQSFVDMFVNEARLAAQLQHPNVVQIFELGLDGDTWFIAMEYVHGRSLHACIEAAARQGRRIDTRVAARVCAQALAALQFAHTLTDATGRPLGILHRDVSPDNVLVSFAGGVKLVDFGIAKAMNARSATRTGALKGKYSYMAPEQLVAGATIDARTDLYAMAVVLHELLTNERPSCVPKSAEEAQQQRVGFTRRHDLHASLNDILEKALYPDPALRFSSANEMAIALEAYIQSTGDGLTAGQVSAWLTELFGADAAQANPAVVPRESMPHGGTDVLSVPFVIPADAAAADVIASAPTMIEKRLSPSTLASASAAFVVEGPATPSRVLRAARPRWLVTGAVVLLLLGVALVRWRDARRPVAPALVTPPVPERVVAVADPVSEAADAGAADPVATAEVKRPAPPRRRVVPKSGHVTVRVNPWAEVIYNGRNYGVTPVAPIEVPPGNASFTLRNKQLGVTRKVTIKVPAGGEVVLKADLFKARPGG